LMQNRWEWRRKQRWA